MDEGWTARDYRQGMTYWLRVAWALTRCAMDAVNDRTCCPHVVGLTITLTSKLSLLGGESNVKTVPSDICTRLT